MPALRALGVVHRDVGALDQRVHVVAVVGAERDADARLELDRDAAQRERAAERVVQAAGQLGHRARGRAGRGAARRTRRRRGGPACRRGAARRAAGRRPRTSSSSPWSWPSVSLTSLKRSRSISSSAASRSSRADAAIAPSQALVEQRAVRQPGQRVVQRLVAQPPRGARDDPEERDEQQREADAEQQVERSASVGADLAGDRRVGQVDLERAVRPEASSKCSGT